MNENNTTQTTQKRKPDVEDVESETKIDQHVAKRRRERERQKGREI